MRIIVIGQAPFGAKVLEGLLDSDNEIPAVYTPPERPGGRADPLREAAEAAGIPTFQPASYKDDQVFSDYENLNPDLTILAFVTDIIPARFFDVPAKRAICYHPSILPRHRGASAINWAIMMGDVSTGLTIFWPDGGIDTGPILLQKEVQIGTGDTTGSLYFDRLFPLGVEAVLESVDLIKKGQAPRIDQDQTGATYEPPCDDRVGEIDWNKPGLEIYNHVRGCDPQPGAFSLFNGEKIRFYGVKFQAGETGDVPGTIAAIEPEGVRIGINGGSLHVSKMRGQSSGKISAAELAEQINAKAGDTFKPSNG